MKRIFNIKTILLLVSVFAGLLITSCSKEFLDRTPQDAYTQDTYYASDAALQAASDPLYCKAWFYFVTGNGNVPIYALGSLRANDNSGAYMGEFVTFKTTSLTDQVLSAWAALYSVITYSNSLISDVTNKCTADVSQAAKDNALGTAYLMRACAYFYGVRTWGPMILFENNMDMTLHPIVPLNSEEDVFTFIIRDLRAAVKLLPTTKNTTGRADKWSAKAMLAKVLLAHSGWNKSTRDEAELDECVKLCEDIIDNSGYSLMPNYEDLFKYKNNMNNEFLLAMRWVVNSGTEWGIHNGIATCISFPEVCDVSCWAYGMNASIDMIKLFNEDTISHDAIRRKATYFIPGVKYSYIRTAEGGYTQPIKSDGTGSMPVKKGVVGTIADNDGNLADFNSPLHTPIIRLAEVYLMDAEASLGNQDVLTGGRGLESFNIVRDRAAVMRKSSITFEDCINEYRREFCNEYLTWFNMISWYRWKPDYMLDYFNNKQFRGYSISTYRINPNGSISYSLNNFNDADGNPIWDTTDGYAASNTTFIPTVLTASNIWLPYPEVEVLQNPNLDRSKPTVPYDFSKW